jgi:hypothetical protein
MTGNRESGNGEVRAIDEQHLTDDELNLMVDGALPDGERERAERHLASCDACRDSLLQFRAITDALAAVPEARVPRSFQLGQQYATQGTSIGSRTTGLLVSMLPAMRAATVAVALILFGSTTYRVLDDPSPSQRIAEQIQATSTMPAATEPPLAQATATQSADTDAAMKVPAATEPGGGETAEIYAADEESSDPAAPADSGAARQNQPVDDTGGDSGEESTPEGGAGNTSLAMEAAVDTSPEATASPTATMTATLAPTVAPTPQPALLDEPDDGEDGWVEWVQIGSTAALLGLLLLWAGTVVSRRRSVG